MFVETLAIIILTGLMLVPFVNFIVGAIVGAGLGGTFGGFIGIALALVIFYAEKAITDRLWLHSVCARLGAAALEAARLAPGVVRRALPSGL